ncbi:hypothetical protein O9929_18440 [Vibrio lentus]|nr:hypothetical protein [Vibrio lentus]
MNLSLKFATVTFIGTSSEVTITINGADDPSEITVGEGHSDTGGNEGRRVLIWRRLLLTSGHSPLQMSTLTTSQLLNRRNI